MMRTRNLLLALLATALMTGAALADPPGLELQTDEAALLTSAEWASYSSRISEALASDNDGLREAALRMVVLHAANLTLDHSDAIEMVKLYRDHPNDRMRRLAVVAINAADVSWGFDMLARSYRFEDVECVRHTIAAALLDRATRNAHVVVEEPTVIRILRGDGG